MPIVTATFEITLPEPFLCECPEGKASEPLTANDRLFRVNVNGFDVEIELGDFSGSRKGIVGSPMAAEITRVIFRVTRDEADSPPVVDPGEDGTIDWTVLQKYLWEKGKEYTAVVEQLIERLSAYFRFRAGHTLVHLHPERGQPRFLNPVWTDEAGKTVWDRAQALRQVEAQISGCILAGMSPRTIPATGLPCWQRFNGRWNLSSTKSFSPTPRTPWPWGTFGGQCWNWRSLVRWR